MTKLKFFFGLTAFYFFTSVGLTEPRSPESTPSPRLDLQAAWQPRETTLPLAFLDLEKFVEFEPAQLPPRAPLAAQLTVNGESVGRGKQFFVERFFAHLPAGQPIRSSLDEDQNEIWTFPVGARFVHEIRFKDSLKTLFEYRMVEKISEDQWGFGIYEPRNGSDQVHLNTNDSDPEVQDFHLISEQGLKLHYQLKPIPQRVCANCHARGGLAGPGPCEFQPGNPTLLKQWAPEYEKIHGWKPIVR